MAGIHLHDAQAPAGLRLYAVGDVHGRLDLLGAMHVAIAAEIARDRPADWRIVHLGDYIDRGPDSRGVLDFVIAVQAEEPRNILPGWAPPHNTPARLAHEVEAVKWKVPQIHRLQGEGRRRHPQQHGMFALLARAGHPLLPLPQPAGRARTSIRAALGRDALDPRALT